MSTPTWPAWSRRLTLTPPSSRPRTSYTYYRTESNLTGLGGYYLYTALAARLGLTARALSDFDIEHLAQDYYGDLYQRSNYKGIRPDLITLYRFSRYDRQYLLTHTDNGETRQYSTLFPTHLAALDSPVSVLLGGIGQRLDLSVVSPFEESMLVFGDETAIAYLPFLSVHYGQVTLIDLSRATPEQLAAEMNALMHEKYRTTIGPREGVDAYLEALREQGVRMCVATATDSQLAATCLNRLGLMKYFAFVVSCEDTGIGKTSPHIYQLAAARLGAKEPGEVAVLEDAPYAAKTARDAGFYAVGVYDPSSERRQQELREIVCEYIADYRTAAAALQSVPLSPSDQEDAI